MVLEYQYIKDSENLQRNFDNNHSILNHKHFFPQRNINILYTDV